MKTLIVQLLRNVFPLIALFLAACGGGASALAPPLVAGIYTLNGTVTGLTPASGVNVGNSITLTNGTDNVTVTADGSFSFPAKLPNGAAYNVALSATTPSAQPCTSTYGAGVANTASLPPVNVICGIPFSGTWAATGSLLAARAQHTATLLPNGKVLVSGGLDSSGVSVLASTELYDPAAGTWMPTGALITARYAHTATLLPNGHVLVSGGLNAYNGQGVVIAELYDPVAGLWISTSDITIARAFHTATLLPDGKVLVSGGIGTAGFLASAELYDPVAGTWTTTGSLVTARYFHTATLLPNGKLLLTGGTMGSGPTASAELYR